MLLIMHLWPCRPERTYVRKHALKENFALSLFEDKLFLNCVQFQPLYGWTVFTYFPIYNENIILCTRKDFYLQLKEYASVPIQFTCLGKPRGIIRFISHNKKSVSNFMCRIFIAMVSNAFGYLHNTVMS